MTKLSQNFTNIVVQPFEKDTVYIDLAFCHWHYYPRCGSGA
jgi:hypothetical protein